MELGFGDSADKETVAAKAKRERLLREAKRNEERLVARRLDAAARLQRWWRRLGTRRQRLEADWDTLCAFSPSHAQHSAGQPLPSPTSPDPHPHPHSHLHSHPHPHLESHSFPQQQALDGQGDLSAADLMRLVPLSPVEMLRAIGLLLVLSKSTNSITSSSARRIQQVKLQLRLAHLAKLIIDASVRNGETRIVLAPLFDKPCHKSALLHLLPRFYSLLIARISNHFMHSNPKITKSSSTMISSATSPYLSGPELRLLILFWDMKAWSNSIKSTQHLNLLQKIRNQALIMDETILKSLSKALGHSITKIHSFMHRRGQTHQHDADDDRLWKSFSIWIHAVLHLSTLCIESDTTLSDSGESSLILGKSNGLDVPWDPHYCVQVIIHIFSTPLLSTVLETSGWEAIQRHKLLHITTYLLASHENYRAMILKYVQGESALFLLGNIVEFFKRSPQLADTFLLLKTCTVLLDDCTRYVVSKASNSARYHPLFQWYSGPPLDIPPDFHSKLSQALAYLWSRSFISLIFQPLFDFDFTSIKKSSADITSLCISILENCTMYISLIHTFPSLKASILNALCWTPHLIPQLWLLIRSCGPHSSAGGLDIFLASTKNPSKEPYTPLLELFCECACVLCMTLDDEDVYEKEKPLTLDMLSDLSLFLNSFCFRFRWYHDNASCYHVIDISQKLLHILYERSSRRPFKNEAEKDWVKKEVGGKSFIDDIRKNDLRAINILTHLPHCVPFASRVEIFRNFIALDKSTLSDLSVMITIRRNLVLEDGFRQLYKFQGAQLKQTIRVKFINELGLQEAGIDHNGVFKEFLEDICKRAFTPDFSLFRTTESGTCVPSSTSYIHESHLDLFEFIGRVFGKALYEGIVIDIPFATFVYAKLLGRFHNFMDELPSLDAGLYKNLVFLKHYQGDVEDLGLFFTVDENVFGDVVSKEIKTGGKSIPVTNENKFEYMHLISDYKLNQECKPQFKALIKGFRSLIAEKYISFFSPSDLQRLMSGVDIDFDVEDLRRYTVYEGGYFDQHSTIRMFWQILKEFTPKEKAALLKFVTSCSKPPVGGFQHLIPPFTIRLVSFSTTDDPQTQSSVTFISRAIGSIFGRGGNEGARLPTSATCFNVLKLPTYQRKSIMKAKLLYAIGSGTGFELS